MRIAHCSDLHLLSLEGTRWLDFANKRWIGGLNLLTNRSRHYQADVFAAMIADFEAQGIDHVLCTGDVTNLGLASEFRFAADHFDEITLDRHDITVLPGNHDAYVAEGVTHFADVFGDYFRSDEPWHDDEASWPMVRVRGHVAIIGVSTSVSTPWFTAYGRIGRAQLARLGRILDDERLAGHVRIVAIHHPPAGRAAKNRVRGLRDHADFAAVIREHGCELILHGHEHRDMREQLAGPDGFVDVLGIQSGTYVHEPKPDRLARYRLVEVVRGGAIATTTRRWSPARERFEDGGPGRAPADVPVAV